MLKLFTAVSLVTLALSAAPAFAADSGKTPAPAPVAQKSAEGMTDCAAVNASPEKFAADIVAACKK